jgi:uncharacterized protein HemX
MLHDSVWDGEAWIRLDAGPGKPCGSGYISADKECKSGSGAAPVGKKKGGKRALKALAGLAVAGALGAGAYGLHKQNQGQQGNLRSKKFQRTVDLAKRAAAKAQGLNQQAEEVYSVAKGKGQLGQSNIAEIEESNRLRKLAKHQEKAAIAIGRKLSEKRKMPELVAESQQPPRRKKTS